MWTAIFSGSYGFFWGGGGENEKIARAIGLILLNLSR